MDTVITEKLFCEIADNNDFPYGPDVQTADCLMQVSLQKKKKHEEEKSVGGMRCGGACCRAGLLMDTGNYLQ